MVSFSLVSLFDGISTFVGHSIPKPFLDGVGTLKSIICGVLHIGRKCLSLFRSYCTLTVNGARFSTLALSQCNRHETLNSIC